MDDQLLMTMLCQIYQTYLDKITPYKAYRWIGTGALLALFFLRIITAQGWYIGMPRLPLSLYYHPAISSHAIPLLLRDNPSTFPKRPNY